MPIRAMTPDFIRPHYHQGLWRPQLLFQLLDEHASRTPDALAVADQHERHTYRQLAERSTALAGWLIEMGTHLPGRVPARSAFHHDPVVAPSSRDAAAGSGGCTGR